ncbi:4671_t:CDS:2 [Entrophospora sp. SA101]|nr:4671_t:CDS:2 [Entrophospora sp. SA101]
MAQFGKMVMLWPKIDVVSPPPFFSPGTLQYKEDVNLVTQIIAGNITNTKLIKNDPLLSGIIDVIFLQSNIVSELKMGNVFDDVNQGLSIDDLPGGLEEFNREYMNKNERYNIPEKYFESEFFDLFIALLKFAKDGWDKMINSFKNKPTDINFFYSLGTIVEIFIVDRKYYPLHRARRLCCIYIPLDDNNESFTETIISLIRIVYSVNQRLKKSLNIINEIEQTSFQELHNIEKNDLVTILTYDSD